MKVTYRQVRSALDELNVIVESPKQTPKVDQLLQYIKGFEQTSDKIPLKTKTGVVLVKRAELILLEVEGKELTFYTLTQKFTVKGSLKQIKERLPEPNFIQVSRYSLINIEYLLAIENSFSGTMVAKLTNDLKTSVSRKYVPAIKEYLGL